MTTAVDSSVLLDLFSADPLSVARGDACLQQAASAGELIVSEFVVAEVSPAMKAGAISVFLMEWNIHFVPATLAVAELAGKSFSEYLARGGKRGRVVADFLIAAHAELLADQLLTTDLGFRRDYFANLRVVMPA